MPRTAWKLANASLHSPGWHVVPRTAEPDDATEPTVEKLDQAQLLALAERGPLVKQSGAQLSSARALSRSAITSYLPQ